MIYLFQIFTCLLYSADAFASRIPSHDVKTRLCLASEAVESLTLSLRKPLGLILEEVEEGKAAGVYVASFAEAGSALEYAKHIEGAKLLSVQGADVTRMDFESVMEKLIGAPDTVDLQFLVSNKADVTGDEYALGTAVTIKFVGEGRELEMKAAVGENLRKLMLDNGIEVYQGMKQKLGNCGEAGPVPFVRSIF